MPSVVSNKERVRVSSPDRVPESEKRDNNNNTCYVCDGRDDLVLECHGDKCFISIHQSCTPDEPDFDESGNFFCPYCWYKRLVLKSRVVDLDGVSENVVAEIGLVSNEQEDKDEEHIVHHHPISIDNVQELGLVVHQPIEAQPFRTVPPPPENGTGVALHVPEQRKRKRVFWTQAEEEMLKAGVEKFPGVRNIPWRKILEFGRDVFHQDRAPSDLKDKWKNIIKSSVA